MKRILLFIVALISGFGAFSQKNKSLFEDAQELNSSLTGNKFNADESSYWMRILGKYIEYENADTLFLKLKSNPYLKDFEFEKPKGDRVPKSNSHDKKAVDFLNSRRANIASIADGVAKFMVQRTKEEIAMAFLEKMKEGFKKYPEFNLLFPKTFAALTTLPSYTYPAYIGHIREEFDEDMANLPQTMVAFLKNPTLLCNDDKDCKKRSEFYTKHKLSNDGIVGLDIGLTTFNSLVYLEKSYPEIINNINDYVQITGFTDPNINNLVSTFTLISNGLIDNRNGDKSWIPEKEFIRFKDPIFRKLFFGLMYEMEEAENIKFKAGDTTLTIRDILGIAAVDAAKLETLVNLIKQIYLNGLDIDKSVKIFKTLGKDDNETKRAITIKMLESGIGITKNLKSLAELIAPFIKIDIKTEFLSIMQHGLNLNVYVLKKDYQGAILASASILGKLFDADKTLDYENMDYNNKDFEKLIVSFTKFGGFLASITQAENSDQIEKIIEQYALPSGSSVMKKYAGQSITINAYAGGGISKNLTKKDWYYGFSAPIGFSYNVSLHNKCVGSLNFYLPLVDIGPLFGYRGFNEKDTAVLPPITLQQIWSPGFMVQAGRMFNTPLTLSAGVQWQSLLKEVNSNGNKYYEKGYWAFKASLTMDLPLLFIWRKNKRNF